MTQTDRFLLDLLGNALFQHPLETPPEPDWSPLLTEAKLQTVVPLVQEAANALGLLPEDQRAQWHNMTLKYVLQNEQLLAQQRSVLALLEEHRIPCVILKGSSCAMWYPDPALRVMGDIDLLVPPEQQLKTVELLQENGYGPVLDETHHCHLSLSKGRITVEVHKAPNGMFLNEDSDIGRQLDAFFADALAQRQWREGLPVLADSHQAVVLILHKLEHFLSGGLGLRQLCDWAVFARKRLTPELWSQLQPFLKACGLARFTGIITRVCVDYLGLPEACVPWAVGSDPILAAEVMEQILTCGNFGRKEKAYGQRYFTDFHTSNRVASFCKTLLQACRHHWPVCERHPVLLPAAPFVIYGKYLRLRRQGKRDALHPVKLYRSAGAKQRLYRELKPFVKEG